MLYTVKETAKKLNCNETVLMSKLAKGEIKGKKQLGSWLISEESLLEYTKGIEEPMTIKEFAKTVRKCDKCIRDNVRSGNLKGAKIGGKWYVDKKELEKFA